jgi:hypothetical protein
LAFSSCDTFIDENKNAENSDSYAAQVIIPLPNSSARNIETAKSDTNYYEIEFSRYRSNGTKYKDSFHASAFSSAGAIEISLPLGTYDILLFAGYYSGQRRSSSSSSYYSSTYTYYDYPMLLATSAVENKEIVSGKNTITMTLLSVDYTLTVPSSVVVDNEITTSFQVTWRNSFLSSRDVYISLDSSYIIGSLLALSSSTTYAYYPASTLETGKTWTITAPTTPRMETITGYAYLDGPWDRWYLFNSSNTVYKGNYPTSITLTEGAGVDVDIGWGDE